jgi:hypothetical protein
VAGVIPSLASVAPVGANLLLARQPLGSFVFIARLRFSSVELPTAAGAADPLGGAGLLVLKPWGLLGRQPAYCLARGTPYKSSPRQKDKPVV